MTPDIRFSVVLPVHNGAAYIREAIDSVLAQTYPYFRLLILENCSDDETLSIIQSYQDERIQLFPSAALLGIEANWQRILDLDLDEFLTILSHDDRILPGFLAEYVVMIEQHPEASLYHSHFYLIDSDGKRVQACLSMPAWETGEAFLRSRHRLERDSYGTGYVMRSADYKRVGGLPPFPALIYADDTAWYRLASLSGKVCSPGYQFEYRVHQQSAASLVGLIDLYHASTQYFKALAASDYFSNAENQALAKHYVEYMFNGYCHRKLIDLIYNGTPEMRAAFQEVKAQFMAESQREPLFMVYDAACKVYERLAYLPSRLLRTWLLQPIELIRWYRQHRRTNPTTIKRDHANRA